MGVNRDGTRTASKQVRRAIGEDRERLASMTQAFPAASAASVRRRRSPA